VCLFPSERFYDVAFSYDIVCEEVGKLHVEVLYALAKINLVDTGEFFGGKIGNLPDTFGTLNRVKGRQRNSLVTKRTDGNMVRSGRRGSLINYSGIECERNRAAIGCDNTVGLEKSLNGLVAGRREKAGTGWKARDIT
jgi:hypothetical protein